MSYPFKWKPLSIDASAKIKVLFEDDSSVQNYVVSEPMGVFGQANLPKIAEKIFNFQVRSDDIWIVTFPKCGTTWTQELVWQIVHNVDIETARKVPLGDRSIFIEDSATIPDMNDVDSIDSVDQAKNAASPRVIKTHLPLEMLPPNLLDTCKVIFVCRSPKDCCVSFYNHYLNVHVGEYNFKGNFSDFAGLFMDGMVQFGNYWTMLKSAWKYKDHPNFKLMWFEDMKEDLISVIKDLAKFLGYHLTQYKILILDDHLYVDNFRKIAIEQNEGNRERQEMMKKFIRKGKVGDWKNYFVGENGKRFDQWISDNISGTDIKFPQSILH